MIRVKVCCISSVEEARLAVRLGASALGLVSEMPSGPGVISEALIAEIAATVPPPIATFLLTSRIDPKEIVAQQKRCGVNTIQMCDRLPSGAYAKLRKALPGVSLVQVIHVIDAASVEEAVEAAREADALLLDSGNQLLPVKELGGTGRTHDWTLSAEIVKKSRVPVFLAGGLNPENVVEAIREVRPFAVDLCSGVRTGGMLDEQKLARFMVAVSAVSQ
ncbi:MAG: phosphoribosylanthranilate isomerase [Candidatus Aminicenantes bacterium]|nr:phosphoribosylanthranilate isomerase [Candidatus Aminicenantes bacterium]